MRLVFEDNLFQEEKCLFVVDLLPNLNSCCSGTVCILLLAIRALLVMHYKLRDEALPDIDIL